MTTMTTRNRHSRGRSCASGAGDRMLGEGKGIADVCCELPIAE